MTRLGVGRSTHQVNDASSLAVSKVNQSYPDFVRFLNRYLLAMIRDIPDSDERATYACDFVWSSICINQNLECRQHRDKNNDDISAIIALDHFSGGDLRYWEEDLGPAGCSVNDLPDHVSTTLPLRRKLQFFDGNRAHQTAPFTGRRTTITWYTVRHAWGDGPYRESAELLGFRLPTPTHRTQPHA